MRVVPAAVLWRENEGTGSGYRSHVSLGEERYGGPGGHAEHGSRRVGPPEAGRQRRTRGLAVGAGRHGDRLTEGILLRVTLGRDLLAGHARGTRPLVWLRRGGTGLDPRCAGCDGAAAAAVWSGGNGPRWRQVHGDVADVDGQSDDCVRRLQRHLEHTFTLWRKHRPELYYY